MKESIFQKELMLIRQINQKNVCFAIIGIFYLKILAMDHIFVMTAIICFKNLYFLCMNKHKAKKSIKKFDLIDKTGSINYKD